MTDRMINNLTLFNLLSLGLGTCLILAIISGLRWWPCIYGYCIEKWRIFKYAKTLPGPVGYPILGNLLELWDTDQSVETLTRIGRKINSKIYRFWMGPGVVKIVVTDARDLEIALMSPKAADKDYVYRMMRPAVIDGIINAPGSLYYRSHKNLIMPQINGNMVINSHVEQFNKQAHKLVQLLAEKVDAEEFDIDDHVVNCMGDVVFESIWNYKGTAQSGDPSVFLKLTTTLLHIVYYRMMRPWFYPDIIFKLTKKGRIYFEVVKEAHIFIDNIIAEKKKNYKSLSPEETAKLPLVDFLVDLMIKTKEWTAEEIRYEAITMFVSSYETMAGIASFALLMIAMRPDIQEKAREEIRNVVQNEDVSESEIKDLKFLDMILRETIRLFPVAPLMPRKLRDDLTLSTGTAPKGTSLFLLPYAAHMNPEYWDEPEKFNPERFTPENSKNRHPYAYIPFSGGMRICPGSKYGMMCLKVVLAHVLRSYQLSTTMKHETLRVHYHISSRSVDGYRISLKKI